MDPGAESYRRWLEGDERAFERIVAEYRQPLVFFINRYVRDLPAAEDLASDVFADLLAHPERYNFGTSLKTYLFMLGRSRAIDLLRRQKKLTVVSLDETPTAEDAKILAALFTDADPAQTAFSNERAEALRNALTKLPAEMRDAVELIYFEGLSYDEAAEVMHITRKKTDNLVYRAKKLLRGYLAGE